MRPCRNVSTLCWVAALILWALLAPDTPASAGELPPELAGREGVRDERPLVYSASKRLERAEEAPAIVQVVSARELWELGYRTVNEALTHLTGFEVFSGRRNTLTFTRGVPNSVLVLLDGISILSSYNNIPGTLLDFGFSLLMVDHIELITSPGGVLWGANTFMGVINIVTRNGAALQGVRVVAGGGSFLYGEGGAVAGASYGNLQLLLAVHAATVRDPTSVIADSPFDQFNRGNRGIARSASERYVDLLAKLRYRHASGEWSLLVRQPFNRNYSALSDNGALLRAPMLGYDDDPRPLYALRWQRWFLGRRLQLHVQARHLETPETLYNPFYPVSQYVPQGRLYYYELSGRRSGVDAEARLRLFQGNDLIVGTDYSFEQVGATVMYNLGTDVMRIPLFPDVSQQQLLGVFAHDQQRLFGKLTLGAGIRFQHLSLFNDVLLASGQAVVGPFGGMHLKLNYSEGIRTPALVVAFGHPELYNQLAPLRVEKSRAAQAQLAGTPLRRVGPIEELRVSLAYTYTRIDDLVLLRSDFGSIVLTAENAVEPLAIQSIDADLEIRAEIARAWVRLTYNRFDSPVLQESAVASASWIVNGGAAMALWARRRLWLQVAVVGLGPVATQVGSRSAGREPVALLEAGLTALRLWSGLEIGIFGRNLTGVRWGQPLPAIPGGVPQPGRSVYARAAWSWP